MTFARTRRTQEDADEGHSNLDASSPSVSAPPQAVVYAASYLLMVPVFEREARVEYSSQSSVHSSIDFRVTFLRYE